MKKEQKTVVVRIEGSNHRSIFQIYHNVKYHSVMDGELLILYAIRDVINHDHFDHQLAKYEIGANDALGMESNHMDDVIYTIFRDYAIEED